MTMHFISGLPRSGSTLLCALLRQNPRYHAGMTSPLYSLCTALLNKMSGASQFATFFTDEKRRRILRSLFTSYYADVGDRTVFDTNRLWTGHTALLAALYPDCRIICCVRDVGWIIDSTERMLHKNPLKTSRLFNYEPGLSIYARSETLMNLDKGFIGHPWSCLREAWFGANASRLILIDYKTLAKKPADTMRQLYRCLDEPSFRHDFERVAFDEPGYDAELGMPGMHTIADRVEYKERTASIPPDLMAKYASLSFWRKPEYQNTGVKVIA